MGEIGRNLTVWTPLPKQADVLQAAMEPGLRRSHTAVCRKAGVSRDSLYRWLRDDPDFAREWGVTWQGLIKRHLPGIVAAQVHKALDGDTAAARLLLEAAGVLKQEGGLTAPVVVRNYIGVRVDGDGGVGPHPV
jgi:hypothetical protein